MQQGTLTKELAGLLGFKDMDGAAACSMPQCPKCLSSEYVVPLNAPARVRDMADGDGDALAMTHYCHKCMKTFNAADPGASKAKEEAEQKAAKIAELIAGAKNDKYLTVEAYHAQRNAEIERQVEDAMNHYLTARMGTV